MRIAKLLSHGDYMGILWWLRKTDNTPGVCWSQPAPTFKVNFGKDVEQRELLYSVGGNINRINNMEIPQKLKTHLAYDLAIPYLSIYPKELKTE